MDDHHVKPLLGLPADVTRGGVHACEKMAWQAQAQASLSRLAC